MTRILPIRNEPINDNPFRLPNDSKTMAETREMTYNLYSILTGKAGNWEFEESHELASRYDIHDHRGVLTPLEAWSPTPYAIMKRDFSVTDSLLAQGAASIGGNLVQTSTADYVTAALRAQSCILNNPGTTLLTIKSGNLNIPRALPSVAGSGETVNVTLLGKPTFGNLGPNASAISRIFSGQQYPHSPSI